MVSHELPVGIVGPGRTRRGLGPYLARRCEEHGLRVVGVAGRDPERTDAIAQQLAVEFGHPVLPHTSAEALAASAPEGRGLAALIVASPPEAHVAGLDAALAAGLACLCEKPLADPAGLDAAAERVAAFAARGLLLVENAQWPFVLPTFDALYPGARDAAVVRRVVLGLSPSVVGPAMLPDALPHLFSLVDAVMPAGALATAAVERAAQRDPALGARSNVVTVGLRWGAGERGGALEAELHLQHCPEPPRPAWLALDGRRIDRHLGPGYTFTFASPERELAARDPLDALVGEFARRLRDPGPDAAAAAAAATAAVARRLDWLRAALAMLQGDVGAARPDTR